MGMWLSETKVRAHGIQLCSSVRATPNPLWGIFVRALQEGVMGMRGRSNIDGRAKNRAVG